ncbi:hypothetical protein AJ79_00541 [Helicocarpus griseus UAMH5409]|uniref:Carbohydrate-binding domain-containing protein n=1 Tax=Helicocarpus griseus UAMH5409 TaxID=1447875 RepID=A0A2B7Y296_9EURO|nr:hypothetical protein AJ79_00541 [Helicocarpus griseus UAMH5409]
MHLNSVLFSALAAATVISAEPCANTDQTDNSASCGHPPVSAPEPRLSVPECPKRGIATFNRSVPEKKPFPETKVELCYDAKTLMLHIGFTAYEEEHFHFDPNQGTNGDIWEYSVMEAFIHRGKEDPQTYLEFEVNPNNVTYQAFIYNPSRVRAEGAPFDHAFISNPIADGILSNTTLDREENYWRSDVQIPLALFNTPEKNIRGSHWKMNFFRTITSPETFPEQALGAWSVPDKASFHITKFFRDVIFV